MNTHKLVFDDGLMRLDINGNGILTFNPSDFNLYERFFIFAKDMPEIEKKYAAEVETIPEDAESDEVMALTGRELTRAKEYDQTVKEKLSAVFGAENDFDKLLGGVNIMAFGSNGQRVITNLLSALQPYIERGVQSYTNSEVNTAKANRAKRRAKQKGKNA